MPHQFSERPSAGCCGTGRRERWRATRDDAASADVVAIAAVDQVAQHTHDQVRISLDHGCAAI